MKNFGVLIAGCAMLVGLAATSNPPRGHVEKQNVYFVILAGGNGERLWPLSRESRPKQLLSIGQDETLLDQAISRVALLAPKQRIWISTTKQHEENIRRTVGHRVGRILTEPGLRNTGPAILLCCLELQKVNPDAVVVFLPADPFIPVEDSQKFAAFLECATDFVQGQNRITLLGVEPTYPAMGYGYIEFNADMTHKKEPPYVVTKFREKPSQEVAQAYLDAGNMLWNIGMFCGKVSLFAEEFSRYAPQIFSGVTAYIEGRGAYEAVVADSIDYAVMEKSNRVSVLPVDFGWCDVGNVEVFLSLKAQHGGTKTNSICVESQNNLVDVPGLLVALVGVEDLCVVQVDDALLITKRGQSEKVKAVVNQLKRDKKTEYL